ncbi:MAG: GAF domain-containing protein, partial [Rubrobacter sp.]|nr:GAF domain-containing protein [Rubrobacter sp.]
MTTKTRDSEGREGFWRSLLGRDGRPPRTIEAPEAEEAEAPRPDALDAPEIDISPNDPILAYLASVSGAVEVENIRLDSPAVRSMREAGIKMVVPLVSQGELIGILNLGPRLSEQEYSSDDRKLLNDLAS